MKKRILSILLLCCMVLTLLPTAAFAAGEIDEQFTLAPGGTYYFDLSAMGIPGTVNDALPDKTMGYVPFTYAGTVDSYKLTSEMATTEEYAQQSKYAHSLFIADFALTHDVSCDELNAGKATWFLKVVTSVVMSVGLFISILSFYILLLSIYLLIQKNTVKLENLLMIGFSPSQVALPYQLLTTILSGAVWIIGMGIVYATRGLYADTLSELCPSTYSGGMRPSILAGCTLFIIVSALNYIIIKNKIASLFFAKRK